MSGTIEVEAKESAGGGSMRVRADRPAALQTARLPELERDGRLIVSCRDPHSSIATSIELDRSPTEHHLASAGIQEVTTHLGRASMKIFEDEDDGGPNASPQTKKRREINANALHLLPPGVTAYALPEWNEKDGTVRFRHFEANYETIRPASDERRRRRAAARANTNGKKEKGFAPMAALAEEPELSAHDPQAEEKRAVMKNLDELVKPDKYTTAQMKDLLKKLHT